MLSILIEISKERLFLSDEDSMSFISILRNLAGFVINLELSNRFLKRCLFILGLTFEKNPGFAKLVAKNELYVESMSRFKELNNQDLTRKQLLFPRLFMILITNGLKLTSVQVIQ